MSEYSQLGPYLESIQGVELLPPRVTIEYLGYVSEGWQAAEELYDHPQIGENRKERLSQLIDRGRYARHCIAEGNLFLVIHVAKKYRNLGLPMEDLIQEGNIGLLHAIDAFDLSKGRAFPQFFRNGIANAIHDAVRNEAGVIWVPDYARRLKRRIDDLCEERKMNNEPQPSLEELVVKFKVSRDVLLSVLDATDICRLEDRRSEESSLTIGDTVRDRTSDQARGYFEAVDWINTIPTLSPLEKEILNWRLGINDGIFRTWPEVAEIIAKKYNMQRYLVSRAGNDALAQIRGAVRINELQYQHA